MGSVGIGNGMFNKTRPKIPQLGVDLNKPEQTFKLVMVLCAVIFFIAVAFFSFARTRFRQIYAPRLLLVENKMFGIGNTSKKSIISLVTSALQTKDEDIFIFAGIDSLVFIRFLRLMLKFALCTMPYGLVILLPLNAVGDNNLKDGLNRLSMSNISAKSHHLWAHWLAVWLYSIIVFYLCWKEWKVYIRFRQRFLKKGLGNQFAVLVKELPDEVTEDHVFYDFVDKIFPNKVSSVYIIKDLDKWDKLIKKHDKLVLKYENAKFYEETKGKRKLIKSGCFGEAIDAITEYEKQLELTQEKLFAEKANGEPLRCGLVFFKSIKAKELALKSIWTNEISTFHVYPAPQVQEIYWDALKLHYPVRKVLQAVGYAIVFFLVLFWAVPITFISSLTKIESLSREFKWLDSILNGSSQIFISFIQGVLPVILIAVFYLILPYILFFVARLQGNYSCSRCAEMVFKCLFVFQTFNTFFIYILSGSVLQNISQIIQEPFQIPSLLAKSLPSQSGFYVNYLALVSFVGLAIELTRIWPLIKISINLKWVAKTARQKLEAWRPQRAEYEVMFSQALLFFLIGLSFSVLSPIIVPFVVLYYAFGYVVWLYQLLHVYIADYDHGGRFWTFVFDRIMICVLVFQLLMVGVFLLKEIWFAAVFLAPLVVCTVLFWLYMTNNFTPYSQYLTLEECVGMKYAERRFLDDVKEHYIRDRLPDVFEMSSPKQIDTQEYIPIDSINIDTDEENSQEMKENTRLLAQ